MHNLKKKKNILKFITGNCTFSISCNSFSRLANTSGDKSISGGFSAGISTFCGNFRCSFNGKFQLLSATSDAWSIDWKTKLELGWPVPRSSESVSSPWNDISLKNINLDKHIFYMSITYLNVEGSYIYTCRLCQRKNDF